MPKFKHQRRAEATAEETARDEGTTSEYARVEGGERPDGSVPSTTTHAHGVEEHDHEGGDEPHTHQQAAPDQAISGAGPDATATPTMRDGYTAPWGTGGFTLSDHAKCMTGEQQNNYWRVGSDALPEGCREGHPRR